jgi:hypothetical protein
MARFPDHPNEGPFEFHPIVYDYSEWRPDERQKLRDNLRKHGFDRQYPVTAWDEPQGDGTYVRKIVGGRHREVEARALSIVPAYRHLERIAEEEMRAIVERENEVRSRTTKLTLEERRARIDAELERDPNRSDRAIAEVAGVGHKTVAAMRRGRGEFPTSTDAGEPTAKELEAAKKVLGKRKDKTGKVGGGQHTKARPKPKTSTKPKAPAKSTAASAARDAELESSLGGAFAAAAGFGTTQKTSTQTVLDALSGHAKFVAHLAEVAMPGMSDAVAQALGRSSSVPTPVPRPIPNESLEAIADHADRIVELAQKPGVDPRIGMSAWTIKNEVMKLKGSQPPEPANPPAPRTPPINDNPPAAPAESSPVAKPVNRASAMKTAASDDGWIVEDTEDANDLTLMGGGWSAKCATETRRDNPLIKDDFLTREDAIRWLKKSDRTGGEIRRRRQVGMLVHHITVTHVRPRSRH